MASKAKKATRSFDEGQKIKVLAEENPKRGKGAKRFAFYRNGLTVGAYIAKVGNRAAALADLRFDSAPERKWIAVS